MSDLDLDALADRLADRLATRAAADSLLDAADVAALLKTSTRSVLERYAPSTGFPKAIRLRGVNGHRGRPRWVRAEIVQWIERHKDGKPSGTTGRPRRHQTPAEQRQC